MDDIIKGMFNQIVGGPQPEEEEEKMAPCVFDDPPVSQTNMTPLQKYANKQIKPPSFPEANVKDFLAKIPNPAVGENGLVKIEAIIGVMQYALELSRKSYADLVLTNRRGSFFLKEGLCLKTLILDRRKVFATDKKTYSRLVVDLLRKTEIIMDEGTKTLLGELNIDKEVFETSIMILMESGYEHQLMMAQANLVQRTKYLNVSFKGYRVKNFKGDSWVYEGSRFFEGEGHSEVPVVAVHRQTG